MTPVVQLLLDEADDYCRVERLLTLAPAPEERAFRHWFRDCFIDQLAGCPPQPWAGSGE